MILDTMAESPADLFRRLSGRIVYMFPNTGNAGDGYIMHATHMLLRRHKIRTRFLKRDDRVEGQIVLFGGGGNLIEGAYETLANSIEHNFEVNSCVLLPHSVRGFARIMRRAGPRLHIYAREPVSYEAILADGGDPDYVRLAEDMAFNLHSRDLPRVVAGRTEGKIACFRLDTEAVDRRVPEDNHDISLSWDGDWWWNSGLASAATKSLFEALAPYEVVATDRLHLCIVAAQLGKRVLFGANSYYKNEAVYGHSLAWRYPGVRFYSDRQDLIDAYNAA